MIGSHNGRNVNFLAAQIAQAVFVFVHSIVPDQVTAFPIQLGLHRRHQGQLGLAVFLVLVVTVILYRLAQKIATDNIHNVLGIVSLRPHIVLVLSSVDLRHANISAIEGTAAPLIFVCPTDHIINHGRRQYALFRLRHIPPVHVKYHIQVLLVTIRPSAVLTK